MLPKELSSITLGLKYFDTFLLDQMNADVTNERISFLDHYSNITFV
jgi:hypothetical protein